MLLKRELISVHGSNTSRDEVLLETALRFLKDGLVKETYPQAIIDRERV